MTNTQIFNQMQQIIESPECVLKSYKDDFYIHDKKIIDNHYNADSSFLWLVRENGTCLAPLRVHESCLEWIEATYKYHKGCKMAFYLIEKDEVKILTETRFVYYSMLLMITQ